MATCTNVSDCSLDGILRECYKDASFATSSENKCDCLNWYGWEGEDCDETSVNLFILRILMSISLIWGIVLFILVLRTFLANMCLGLNPTRNTDPVFYTAPVIMLYCLLMITFSILQLNALFDSSAFIEVSFGIAPGIEEDRFFRETIAIKGGVTEVILLSLAFTCFSYGIYFLSLSMERCLIYLGRFANRTYNNTAMSRYIKFVLTYLGLNIIAYAVEAFALISILNGILLLIHTYVFIRRTQQFREIVSELLSEETVSYQTSKEKNKPVRPVEVIKRTCVLVNSIARYVMICAITIGVFCLLYLGLTIFYVQPKKMPPGTLNYAAIFRDCGFLIGFYMFTIIAWYFNSTTEGIIILEGRYCSGMFSRWDRKNAEIFPEDIHFIEEKFPSFRTDSAGAWKNMGKLFFTKRNLLE